MFGAIAGGIASALAGGAMSKLFGGGQKAASGGIQGDVLATDNNTVGMGDAGIKSAIQGSNVPNPDEAVPSFVSGAMAKAGKGLLEGTLQAGTSAVSDKLDRKSGSAGMPRPISYAVFCLKKKNLTDASRHAWARPTLPAATVYRPWSIALIAIRKPSPSSPIRFSTGTRISCMMISTVFPTRMPLFFFNDPAPTEIYTLSLHDALPIFLKVRCRLALLPFLISCLIWLDLVASLPLIKERILVIILLLHFLSLMLGSVLVLMLPLLVWLTPDLRIKKSLLKCNWTIRKRLPRCKMRLKKRLLAFSRRLHARIRKTRYMHKMRCLLINRRSLLLALRLLWKTPIFPSNSRFPRLCAKCLLKLKRLVSILPMTKSKK